MENYINKKFVISEHIGNGKFGQVYKGKNIRTKEIVAIKFEKANSIFKLLKRETTILNYLYRKGVKNVPYIYWYGKFDVYSCLVMTHFQENLLSYVINIELTVSVLFDIFTKCIALLESIHRNTVLHRDIKPQNFMIKNNEIYLIDYGLAIFFTNNDGDLIEKIDYENVVGTPKYISYFNHNGEPQSRRDDLLSLGYIYLYFKNGSLPWENTDNIEDSPKYNETSLLHPKNIFRKNLKQFHMLEYECDQHILNYFDYCYSLNWNDDPDYEKLKNIFKQMY